jgi:uncharacterized protein DUF3617
MRAAPPIAALAALASLATLAGLSACNRSHTGAKVAIPAADAAPADPQMAGGLWRQRVSGAQGVSVTRYCLDASAASALASFNQQLSGRCAEHQMALSADGAWRFRTACDTALGKLVTSGAMRGDFASHYVVEAQQQSVGGVSHVTADVKRLGDCPSDMKPGDVVLPGGARSRLSDLPASA